MPTKDQEPLVVAHFSFEPEALSSSEIAYIFESKCCVEASRYRLESKGRRRRNFKHRSSFVKAIKASWKVGRALAENESYSDPSIWFWRYGDLTFVRFKIPRASLPEREFFEELISFDGCNGGYIAEEDDLLTDTGPGDFEDCCRYELPGLAYYSAWRMWFAGKAYEYFPKDRILGFDQFSRLEEIERGIFLELYENVEDFALPENRERQLALVQWLDFRGVHKRVSAELVRYQTGQMPSGRWYFINWMNPAKEIVGVGEATQARVAWSIGGGMMYDEIVPKEKALEISEHPGLLDDRFGPDFENAEPDVRFRIRLMGFPGNKVQVIKTLAASMGISLAEAKAKVDEVPCLIFRNLQGREVKSHKEALEAVGAEVRVELVGSKS